MRVEGVASGVITKLSYSEGNGRFDESPIRFWRVFEPKDGGIDASEPRYPWLLATAGPDAFSLAIAQARERGDLRALRKSLGLMLEATLGDASQIVLGVARRNDAVDEYPVSARGKRESFATCHGLYETISLSGKLTVRAADGAFVRLALSGTDVFVEDVCSSDGRSRERYPQKTGELRLTIRRDCFAPALEPQ